MVYKTYKPAPPLARHVEFFWFFDGLFPSYALERVLPQGSFELVIDLREVPRKLFTNADQTCWREFRRAWISGAHSKFIVIDMLPGSSMMGVHFQPGGAATFLPMPADELADGVEEIDQLWGRVGHHLREALLEAQTPEEKFSILERFLLSRLRPENSRQTGIDVAIDLLGSDPATGRISELSAELGISHKQFIAKFRGRVGLTPKRFCRVRRFQRALVEIETRKSLDWAGIAADTGYYDQAHFIHDFTGFSGLNPSAYLTERGEYMNYLPLYPKGESRA